MKMKRYWFTFVRIPKFSPLSIGCGVTAADYSDAISILKERVLIACHGMEVCEVVEDVDINSLDSGHVLPNMGNVACRGVWFPLGY